MLYSHIYIHLHRTFCSVHTTSYNILTLSFWGLVGSKHCLLKDLVFGHLGKDNPRCVGKPPLERWKKTWLLFGSFGGAGAHLRLHLWLTCTYRFFLWRVKKKHLLPLDTLGYRDNMRLSKKKSLETPLIKATRIRPLNGSHLICFLCLTLFLIPNVTSLILRILGWNSRKSCGSSARKKPPIFLNGWTWGNRKQKHPTGLGNCFKPFKFVSPLGEMIPIWRSHIFQRGWNHQLVSSWWWVNWPTLR